KQRAVQAYLEWMPVRDPVPGAAREALWRSFDFGDVATISCLESRLTGRSEEISWSAELDGVAPADIPAKVGDVLARASDPARTMLGAEQEAWLAATLKASTESGRPWQVLANQVIMASVVPPNFRATLTPEQIAALPEGLISRLVDFSTLGVPFNLDAWDGFPAARERLYGAAKAADATLVTLTGDTHTAWANPLKDMSGAPRGVEFGCTSVTSPGLGSYMPIENLGELFADANEQVAWYDPFGNGYTLLTFAADSVNAEFRKVSTIETDDYTVATVAKFRVNRDGDLERLNA
ncbi:MAG: alkaline phosphatase D family protein, partial [Pseudomonadota bacterium]